ncbi:MEDS domain-containing protein [Bacillus sp. ISL-35]|uniref:MEDS domain-containing protein n=1 Tax=Bacillus sp. ISL-35 TaxID=2819122 RepID=UPI001BEB41F4|nr:MEDS domain-containing protein [Bacillus sp. ISL-35]MBT2679991.1 MEDS domain-containing protein [Bacillus sp. ISL-35]MBT2703033.1 MEDS domain-containing protein [Chryseobacterium sp. ISL-80]
MSCDLTHTAINHSSHQTNNLETLTEGHVFYRFQDEEIYINKLISFIKTGIEKKEHILIIENMRTILKIKSKIDSLFSDEQQQFIFLVNNFDYYLSSGDFNTKTILKYFQKDLSALKKLNSSIRTWAQVDWASTEPDEELLKEFESSADDFVIEARMLSVCAYVSHRLSNRLHTALEQFHKYTMTDDEFHLSSLYMR